MDKTKHIEEIWRDGYNRLQKIDDFNIKDKSNLDIINKYSNQFNYSKIEFYEVLTDHKSLWVSAQTLQKICLEINKEKLDEFSFIEDNSVVQGKKYFCVNEDFLIYIYNNTNNPKYRPKLVLLKTMDYPQTFNDDKDNDKEEMEQYLYR